MFHVIRETEHTPQVSMDFPVSFASTGISAAGGQRRGAAAQNVWEGPLSFWSPEGGQKNELKN